MKKDIVVYSKKNCSQCIEAENYLMKKNYQFKIVKNEKKLLKLAIENDIKIAPVIMIDGNYYNFEQAVEVL